MFIQTPNETDHVSGGRVQYHPENPNIFEVLTWTNFSKTRNRYNGSVSTWQLARYIDPETKSNKLGAFLLEVHVIYSHNEEWRKLDEMTQFYSLPEQHIRRAAKEGRDRLGIQRFDQVHISVPKENWQEWLVDPSDQVIGSSHTANLAR